MAAPPPPPPHGENPKSSSGLPPGKYDIFIIPEHSSGSGFLYLPSLKPNVNSFAAGFASALILVVIGSALAPAVMSWWNSVKGAGGAGMIMLMLAVGVGAWALGRIQTDGGPGPGGGGGTASGASGGAPNGNAHSGAHSHSNGYASGPPPNTAPPPGAGSMPGGQGGPTPGGWQRSAPQPEATGASQDADGAAKSAWERAREETRKKEEQRKADEAAAKKKAELEKRLAELRAREAREREAREQKLREEGEKVAREKMQKEQEAAREKLRKEQEAAREKAKKEEEAREAVKKEEEAKAAKKKEDEARLKKLKDEADRIRRRKEYEEREKKRKADEAASKANAESKPRGSTYAFSAVGEKTSPWPNGRPPSPTKAPPVSPLKRPPPPTAKTYRGTEDDSHSYRPYDRPKKPLLRKSQETLYSESSYAASQSTSRTTPPPSHRGPYSTKDPDKIVIKAVYSFNNAFLKTPTSQLVSGVGSVTDGLILRITTEGLFIDDDVRGVPQREWDVKAWTMKLVEVWCPSFRQGPAGVAVNAARAASTKNFRRLWGLDKEKPASSEETDALLVDMLNLCKSDCRLSAASYAASSYASSESSYADSAYGSSVGSPTNARGFGQTGEHKNAKLHVLRASIRDQEGKKYVFIIGEEESWKVAVGLQRLRKGTQVRALGVSGMSSGDAKGTLEHLGWVS